MGRWSPEKEQAYSEKKRLYGEHWAMPVEIVDEFEEPCNGKITYRSEKHARRCREAVYHKRNTKLRVYQCDECFGWHLTSSVGVDKPLYEDRVKR